MKAIILAAGKGKRLRPLTNRIPKCMITICGKPMLKWQVELLKKYNVNDITVATGSLGEKIKISDVSYIKNKFYRSTEQNYSLFCARKKLTGSVIISFADVIFNKKILKKLIDFKGDCGIAVRKDWKKAYRNRSMHPTSEADNVLLKRGKIATVIGAILGDNFNKTLFSLLISSSLYASARTVKNALSTPAEVSTTAGTK